MSKLKQCKSLCYQLTSSKKDGLCAIVLFSPEIRAPYQENNYLFRDLLLTDQSAPRLIDHECVSNCKGVFRSPTIGNGNPLQYSCLEYLTNREWACYSPQGLKESNMTECLSTDSLILHQTAQMQLYLHIHYCPCCLLLLPILGLLN